MEGKISKAIVTGVAGFIGSHIAERLVSDGAKVIGIDDLSAGKKENIPKGVKFINLDVCDIERASHHFIGCDAVFHNAASKKNICLNDPARDLQVNGYGTLAIARLCSLAGVKLVHASTGSVYGNGKMIEWNGTSPVSYYGVSKLAGEKYIQMTNCNWTILRYFHVYGPRQENDPSLGGVVAIFHDLISQKKPITIHGDGSQVRSFTHVSDVVEANIRAARLPIARSQVYNVASGIRISIHELAEQLMAIYGKVPVKYSDPLIGDIKDFEIDNTKIINDFKISFKKFNPENI